MREDVLPFDVRTAQETLFPEFPTPAESDDLETEARAALDELVQDARMYRSGPQLRRLLEFVGRFRAYSPFNAMLVQMQMEGATFVAPPSRWRRDYGRRIEPGSRPLVILRPRGPVMFVFDVSDTAPADEKAPPLPDEVTNPFVVTPMRNAEELLARTVANAARDGVRVVDVDAGSQLAGRIMPAEGTDLEYVVQRKDGPHSVDVPQRYVAHLNANHDASTRLSTLAHELGHLYCGHVGSPNEKWWPSRPRLKEATREIEAEATAYVVCKRADDSVTFPPYLDQYLNRDGELPTYGLHHVLKAAGLIGEMTQKRLPLRKQTTA